LAIPHFNVDRRLADALSLRRLPTLGKRWAEIPSANGDGYKNNRYPS
jgi:hypothetical protein